jgi:hypothetical protein
MAVIALWAWTNGTSRALSSECGNLQSVFLSFGAPLRRTCRAPCSAFTFETTWFSEQQHGLAAGRAFWHEVKYARHLERTGDLLMR